MSNTVTVPKQLVQSVLLGDEAVGLGALHAGISAAYGYPGTPSTEALEFVLRHSRSNGQPKAAWCANEKSAYEAALGTSIAGRRSLVTMKHVGLNVAADPFVNSGVTWIGGGLVLAVADDPGMHSSQNEQDSRFYADFARIPCFEPSNAQEAYEMTRTAFDLSEQFQIPVMLRLVTRVAHGRSQVRPAEPLDEKSFDPDRRRGDWILLPAMARRLWHERLGQHRDLRNASEESEYNTLFLHPKRDDLGVVTCGVGRNYYFENLERGEPDVSHLHIAVYPPPTELLRALAAHVKQMLIVEEGYPFVERFVQGVLPSPIPVFGKLTGHLPEDGELTPETVRWALGLPDLPAPYRVESLGRERPPRLCQGCPHCDAYAALDRALRDHEDPLITSDIGCYTLGILPPYSLGDSCVCMGASIGMAKGAADAGARPVVALIGDSTFLHSGIPPLIDAVVADSDMTVVVLDNEVVAMTGSQPSVLPSERLREIVLGIGVDAAHCHLVRAHPNQVDALAELLRREIDHRGVSVVIVARECLESVRKRKGSGG